jgi:hypothetical protein
MEDNKNQITHRECAVIVVLSNAGLLITPNVKNPEYGTIRVEQKFEAITAVNGMPIIPEEGQAAFTPKDTRRVAFLPGSIAALTAYALQPGQVLPGRIRRAMSWVPMYPGQKPVQVGDTGVPALLSGSKYYAEYYYSQSGAPDDRLIRNQMIEG